MNNDSLKKIIQEQFKTDEKEIRDLYEEIA